MKTILLPILLLLAPSLRAKEEPPKPSAHTLQNIEGWKVQVDQRLLEGEGKPAGDEALKLLGARLHEIAIILPADKVARLREVPIWLDLTHGRLRPAQYHPEAEWLKENGYDTAMARCVHIPVASLYIEPADQHRQPWAVLHELAHAYHDQVLGFDHPGVLKAYEAFRASGKYEKALHIAGHTTRHYGLTDHKEFFSEMTEAYFGINDFFPFHRADLMTSEPAIYALMKEIWGPVP